MPLAQIASLYPFASYIPSLCHYLARSFFSPHTLPGCFSVSTDSSFRYLCTAFSTILIHVFTPAPRFIRLRFNVSVCLSLRPAFGGFLARYRNPAPLSLASLGLPPTR